MIVYLDIVTSECGISLRFNVRGMIMMHECYQGYHYKIVIRILLQVNVRDIIMMHEHY